MTIEFIAMAIVLFIMIVIAVIMLKSLSNAAGIKIRADMKKLLRSYDNLIDEKSSEIEILTRTRNDLAKEIARLKKKEEPVVVTQESESAPVGTQAILPSVSYRSSELGKSYEIIKNMFRNNQNDRSEMIRRAMAEREPRKNRGPLARKLISEFSFDTLFTIGAMDPMEQLKLLDSNLNDTDWSLLKDYCDEKSEEKFDISDFWNWLNEIAIMENDQITVLSGDKQLSQQQGLEYNEQICEGFQIRTGNHLYDYSIQEREIN